VRSFVLDANAAIDYLEAGQGANKIEELLLGASRQQLLLYISSS
jgi:hypothetical protein